MLMFVECGFSSQNYNGSTSFAIVNSSNKFARLTLCWRRVFFSDFLRKHYFSPPGNMAFLYFQGGGGDVSV